MATHIDAKGIRLSRPYDGPLDVLIGGHRVWSFTTSRDAVRAGGGLFVAWPRPLATRLDGQAEVALVPHNGGEALFTGPIRFGRSTEPLALVDDLGNPLSLDKGGRLQRTFDDFADESRAELVAASHRVLVDLTEQCGLDAYLCYGGLLGAARSGRMIGHDSDLDLAFLSRYTHPFDIIQETRAAERQMAALGWKVVRMSAANFKIWVPLPSGKRAGVDVFGSFHIGDHFHITGSLRGRLDRSAIVPFGEIDLEGVAFAAPADVPRFLEFTYGPGWKVPDPAFHFDHPPENVRRMSQWFRGARSRLPHWQEFYRGPHERVPSGPSAFAAWAHERMGAATPVVELGSGTGRDAVWLAQRGHHVLASDFCSGARTAILAAAREAEVRVPYRPINLESLHSSLVAATRFAHDAEPRHVYARGLVDALAPTGRLGLWRFCATAGRRGGLTFLEFRTPANVGRKTFFGPHQRTYADPDAIVAEIEQRGGRIVERLEGRGLAPLGNEDPVICRLVVSWERP
ncbi:MAG: class I SAM-dependent methyltransferase [Propionibacteriales bacterium]|nr:class I SAM-dependent methyltransferase [Propionibacteriales bacterium]